MKSDYYTRIKKIVIGIFFLLMAIAFVCLYEYFRPTEVKIVVQDVIEETNLNYQTAIDHIMENEEIHYMWLCDMTNDDCIYVRDYIIKDLSDKNNPEDFEKIEMVDFHEAPNTLHYRSSVWGIDYIPAFIAVKNTDGQMEVLNYLSWNKNSPFTSADLKDWMYKNGLWTGEYEIIEKIDEAIE